MKRKTIIAFDVDDTLIVPSVVTGHRDVPNYETIALYKWFQAQGNHMIIWSGSGIDWCKMWNEKLGLNCDEIRIKEKIHSCVLRHMHTDACFTHSPTVVDIAFDDCDVDLAKVNINVKRFNNDISRKDWNQTKRLPIN